MKVALIHLSLCCACMGATSAMAADFSDNTVSLSYGAHFSTPGANAGNVNRAIVGFTHFSADQAGTNFFAIDALHSNTREPSVGSTVGNEGTLELYSVFVRDWSYAKVTGNKVSLPGVRDFSLTGRLDIGTKNDTFGGRPVKAMLGPTINFDVPGYLNVGLYGYAENLHNGYVGKNANFRSARLETTWSTPLGISTDFSGYAEITAPKGKDSFGYKTKTETLLQASFAVDLGALAGRKKNGVQLGVGVQYWHNKFGADPAKFGGKTTRQLAPMISLTYHL